MNKNIEIGKKATLSNEIMTPEAASKLVDDAVNDHNRHRRQGFVEFLSRVIRDGGWTVTGDCVCIDVNGKLANGQHRLHAIVDSGQPVRIFVARNMPVESYANTDVGIKRAQHDNLGIEKELAADAKLIAFKLNEAQNGRITNEKLKEIVAWYLPIYDTEKRILGGKDFRARGANSGVRIGFGLRYAVSARVEREYVMNQFKAFMKSDPTAMSKCVAAAWRRSVEGKEFNRDRSGRIGLLNFLYHASAYERRDRDNALLRHPKALDDETTQWLELMADAYAAGPMRDNHPYLFSSKPVVVRDLQGAAADRHAERKARQEAA